MYVYEIMEKLDRIRYKIECERSEERPDEELIDMLQEYQRLLMNMKVSK